MSVLPPGIHVEEFMSLHTDLANMQVRASMSVVGVSRFGRVGCIADHLCQSIVAFGQLWGLVACHSYGNHGMRVSFPVRQMLRLLSQSISRNVERLSYAQRLTTRKLVRGIIVAGISFLRLTHALVDQHHAYRAASVRLHCLQRG